MDFKLVEVTQEMRDKWLHDEIMDKGLLGAVKEQLDEWVDICHPLGYLGFSEAIERAQNITDLIKKCAEIERKHPNSEFIEYEEFPDNLPEPEEDNPVVGVKLNLNGSWTEVREKDKWYTDPITKAGDAD